MSHKLGMQAFLHPLRVYHPGKGVHHICRWLTHNEQHQLIVAPTEQAVRYVWELAYKRYDDAKVVQLFEVELVAPSAAMCSKALILQRDADIKSFMNDACGGVSEALKLGLPLPSQFAKCPGFVRNDDEDDSAPDSIDLKYHFDCRNCTHGIALVGLTPEQFYERFSDAWNAANPSQKMPGRYQQIYSTAEPASDDEQVWEASCDDFGHHRSGVNLNKLRIGEPPWHNATPWGFFHPVLFYFRLRREMDIAPYNQAATTYRDEQKKLDEAKRQLMRAKRQMDETQAAEKKMAVFRL